MQTVVLAAGQGTRMGPLTEFMPKPMLPVAGKPMLEHVLDLAIDGGASRFIIVVGYEGALIREHFGEKYRGVAIEYVTQDEQAGTAHALRCAADHLEEAPFVVLNGDGLYGEDALAGIYEAVPAVGASRVEDPRPYGVLALDDGHLTAIEEKPDNPLSNLVNTGAYAFPAVAQQWLSVDPSDRGEYELTDVLERVIDEFSVTAVEVDRWLDVGRPWELLEATEWKLETTIEPRIEGEVAEGATIDGPVVIEDGATIEDGVVIEGPVIVKADATVGPNAYLRAGAVIDAGAKVGHAVEVKNSILMADASVGHLSYVGDSVLGPACNFGAGTTVANLRHDEKPVSITVKGERVSTGRRKFGVVVGPEVHTGINTSLNAGVTLAAGATTSPGAVVMEDR